MHQILRNYFILLLFCFYSVLGISPKLSIVEYRPFPEKISLLGIEPTQINWSIANKFLLFDENRSELLEVGPFGDVNLTSGFTMRESRFGELIWMGMAPDGIRIIDRMENEIIYLDYRLNPIQAIGFEHRIFPEMATIDPWGIMYLYSKTYNGIFSFERSELSTLPFIDLSKESSALHCLIDISCNQDGDIALLGCNGYFQHYSRNGQKRSSTILNINDPAFLVSLRGDWLVFNRQGDGISINTGDHLSIPASSIPVMDIRSMNRSIAVLTKDHILILDVK